MVKMCLQILAVLVAIATCNSVSEYASKIKLIEEEYQFLVYAYDST